MNYVVNAVLSDDTVVGNVTTVTGTADVLEAST